VLHGLDVFAVAALPAWDAGVQPEDAPDKVNELYLPAGELR